MDLDRAKVRARLAAERDETIAVLERAVPLVDLIEPESLRAPLAGLFRARAQELRQVRSVLGQPVVFAVQLAEALIVEEMRRGQ